MSVTRAIDSTVFDELWASAVRSSDLDISAFNGDLSSCSSVEDAITVLQKNKVIFKVFREKGQKIRGFMEPFANLVGLVTNSGAEAAAAVGVPGGKAVFCVFGVLLAATKGVSEVYDALEKLLEELQSFLWRLETYLAKPSVIKPALKDVLVKILAQLLAVLALCAKRLDDNVHSYHKVKIFSKRAEEYGKVLLGNKKVQEALKKLDGLINKEQLQLVAGTAVVVEKIGEDVLEVRQEQLATSIRDWLSPPNPRDTHYRVRKSRKSETGEWFFGPRFLLWKESKDGVYWIHGKPGSGKSVLFSAIVDKLEQQGVCAYFYFDSKQTVRGLISSLIHQLALQSAACLVLLKRFHADQSKALGPPSDDKLVECLKAMLRAPGRVHMLIDALDECPEERRHGELLPLLKQIRVSDQEGLRLLFTSRPEPDIQECMRLIVTEQLSLQDVDDQASALARHVSARLDNIEDYCEWPEELRSRAKDVIITKADGMFLWADLQLERLRRCHPSAVGNALETLPVTLYDTYERILAGIEADNALLAHRVFECIAFAARPLTPEELAEALTMELVAEQVVLRPEYRTANPERWLQRTCSSLIQIVNGSLDDEDKRLVQFVHFSAQEYLLSVRLPDSLSKYSLVPTSAHTTLSRLCLSVLNSPSSLSTQPFAKYAVRNWTAHVQPNAVQEAVKAELSSFLVPDSPSFSRWLEEWMDRFEYQDSWDQPYNQHSTPLYIAAHLGLQGHVRVLVGTHAVDINAPDAPVIWASAAAGHVELTRWLLERGAAVDAADKYDWTPLQVVARNGQLSVAQLLLEHNAAVDVSIQTWTPLHLAAENGHVDVARSLLDHGADVDAPNREKWTPLHVAAEHGHTNVAGLLLERGADIHARNKDESTPLYLAAQDGHVGVAGLLLKHGAAADAHNAEQWTSLHIAAWDGHLAVARLLLECGAAVDARRREEETPLYVAAERGHVDVAALLLEHSATVDALQLSKWTPLHVAALDGHVNVVRLLLEHGAVVDACEMDQWTPLFVAAQNGHVDAARLLLERGAAVDAPSQTGRTPLHEAAKYGHVSSVLLLLNHGANLDARHEDEATPLHIAAAHGHTEVAHLLLEHVANVDVGQIHKQTPLHLAALMGNLDTVRLLIEHNAALEAHDRWQSTPLYLAVFRGRLDVVRYLLDCRAASDVCIDVGWTILHAAALSADTDTLKFVLGLIANVDQRNHAGRTALLCAAGDGHEELVRILLDHGASIAACDQLGFSALDYAAAGGHADVARLLLERGADIRFENAPHGSCAHIAERARRAGASHHATEQGTWTFRGGDAHDVARLLQQARPTVARGDAVLHRLRRYRSVGSWGDIWSGVEDAAVETATADEL